MIKRLVTALGAVGAIAALALGGSAIAGAQQSPAPTVGPSQQSTAPESSAADHDNVQSSTGPDPADSGQISENAEAPGTDKPEKGEKSETPGSEAPGDDGPGGHADEPATPNANHQAEGEE